MGRPQQEFSEIPGPGADKSRIIAQIKPDPLNVRLDSDG